MSFCPDFVSEVWSPTHAGACVPGSVDQALVCVTEPLDIVGAAPFLERAGGLAESCRCLVVDLQRTAFIDSAGVRMLMRLAEELEASGKELRLVIAPGSRVERTLNLLCLLSRFRTYSTLESAWAGEEAAAA